MSQIASEWKIIAAPEVLYAMMRTKATLIVVILSAVLPYLAEYQIENIIYPLLQHILDLFQKVYS